MLAFYGIQIDTLTITLLWNAEADLDVSFTCDDDGVTIDWTNMDGNNTCGAILDVD